MKTEIYLKGGNVIELNVESLTATRQVDNSLSKLEWVLKDPNQKILYIRLDEIQMVITRKSWWNRLMWGS